MAMAGNHSPRHSSDNLQSRLAAPPPFSSPWNQVVRGESEPGPASPSSAAESASAAEPSILPSVDVAPSPAAEDSGSAVESSEDGGGNNGGAVKRPAWNKPSSNGVAAEVRPVMDAVSWPALSESTRAAMKSESSSKGLLDVSSSVPQSQGTGSKTSSFSQRQVGDNASANNMVPTRQRSFKHNSSNASSNGGHPQQSAASQVSIAVTGSHNYSPKDHTQRSGFVSNDHPQHRNSFRNRNGGPHQRGDGAHHHNYGNRRDQDWNTHRSFNGRDTHMPPRVVPRFIRPPPPPNSAQFIHTPPVRPFGGHIGFHELAPPMVYVPAPPPHPDSLRGVHFVPPMPHHALFLTGPDPQLQTKIVNQINYYFSNENLIKDTFLRQNMDDHGWVPIKLIAGFNKMRNFHSSMTAIAVPNRCSSSTIATAVMHLTDNIQVILDAVRTSSVVEVQGDKIRRLNDWRRWIIPPSLQFPNVTGSQTVGTVNHDLLAEQVQNIALETTNYDGTGGLDALPDASQHKPSYGDLNNPLQLSSSEGTGQVGIQGSDHSISARN